MSNISSSFPSSVPSIHIHEVDDPSALFDVGDMFSTDMYNLNNLASEVTSVYACSRSLHSEYLPPNTFPNSPSDLEDIPELSHLSTTNQPYLTGLGYSLPYSTILQENGTSSSTDRGLSPCSLGSPVPSPASSFASSLSPSSFYEPITLSDSESPVSPSPTTPDQQFLWPFHGLKSQSSDSLTLQPPFMGSFPDDSILPPCSLGSLTHRRSKSSPSSRREPVASKAMLEANGRRRRHPAQFECEDCKQTFTALFSLKRHQQSHTGERPFTCSIPGCTQRFYNSSDCKRHEKSKKRHKEVMMQ